MASHSAARRVDRYVVEDYLAEGGMGAIYVGKKLGEGGFERQVVLKQLLPEYTSKQDFIDLFLREAKISASLDHANIIHTIDLVVSDNEHFIVMEYLPGADLRTLARRARRRSQSLAPAAAIYIGREVLAALAYAHRKRDQQGNDLALIHRDISPSNILVSHDGEVKLTDFGIAKAATHQSIFYRVKGKVGYMSPEQARNEPIDARSDLFSLAVCLWEVIAGERLFIAPGITATPEEIYGGGVPPLSEKCPSAPPALETLFSRALSLDPAGRFQTAGAFQEALMRVAYEADLLMGAPELAEHLRVVCGEPGTWRESDEFEPEGTQAIGGGSTEALSQPEERAESLDWFEVGEGDKSQLIPRETLFPKAEKSTILQKKELTMTSVMAFVDGVDAGDSPLFDPANWSRSADASMDVDPAGSSRLDTVGGEIEVGDGLADRLEGPPVEEDVAETEKGTSTALLWVIGLLVILVCVGVALLIGFSGP